MSCANWLARMKSGSSRGGEDGGYLARVPTFPGIVTSGDTPKEALGNGDEAIECLLESRMKIGKPYPEPEQVAASQVRGAGRGHETVPTSTPGGVVEGSVFAVEGCFAAPSVRCALSPAVAG